MSKDYPYCWFPFSDGNEVYKGLFVFCVKCRLSVDRVDCWTSHLEFTAFCHGKKEKIILSEADWRALGKRDLIPCFGRLDDQARQISLALMNAINESRFNMEVEQNDERYAVLKAMGWEIRRDELIP